MMVGWFPIETPFWHYSRVDQRVMELSSRRRWGVKGWDNVVLKSKKSWVKVFLFKYNIDSWRVLRDKMDETENDIFDFEHKFR